MEDNRPLDFLAYKRLREAETAKNCPHPRYVIDKQNGSVECNECGAFVSAFHVLCRIIDEMESWVKWKQDVAKVIEEKRAELAAYKPHIRAVKELEKTWRSRSMLPLCPHCRRGVEAKDLAGTGSVSREYDRLMKGRDDA